MLYYSLHNNACLWPSGLAILITNYQVSLYILNKPKVVMIMAHYRISYPYFLFRYDIKVTIFNLKGIKIHIITINTDPSLQMTTMQKSESWLCSNLTGSQHFLHLYSLTSCARGNSKDIWIQIFWRNVYLATEYMLKGIIYSSSFITFSLQFCSSHLKCNDKYRYGTYLLPGKKHAH